MMPLRSRLTEVHHLLYQFREIKVRDDGLLLTSKVHHPMNNFASPECRAYASAYRKLQVAPGDPFLTGKAPFNPTQVINHSRQGLVQFMGQTRSQFPHCHQSAGMVDIRLVLLKLLLCRLLLCEVMSHQRKVFNIAMKRAVRQQFQHDRDTTRSEERRVGKECRSRWTAYQ